VLGKLRKQKTGKVAPVKPLLLQLTAQLQLRRFHIAVHSPTTVQHIEAEQITGFVSPPSSQFSDHRWRLSVSALALSLSPQQATARLSAVPESTAKNRLATFIIDLNVSSDPPATGGPAVLHHAATSDGRQIHVHMPRIKAVMQPAAIDALADLIDHYILEIGKQKQKRAAEIAQVQQQLLQTLDKSDIPRALPKGPSFLQSYVLSLVAQQVDIAIPLDLEATAHQQKIAFVLSIHALSFVARHASAGQAQITNLGFHFVDGYDWLLSGKPLPSDRTSHNKIVFPSMTGSVTPKQLRQDESHLRKVYRVEAKSDGIAVACDPTVVRHFFQLVEVFQLSRQRFDRLSQEFLTGAESDESAAIVTASAESSGAEARLQVEAYFFFQQSHILLYHSATVEPTKPLPTGLQSSGFRPKHRRGQSSSARHAVAPAEDIILPMLTVAVKYEGAEQNQGTNSLHVDAVVGASTNTLYPSLLPFVSAALREAQHAIATRDALRAGPAEPESPADFRVPSTSMFMSISLRIEASRLVVSCYPNSQVQASVDWQGGGAVLTTEPHARGCKLAFDVQSLGFDLGHEVHLLCALACGTHVDISSRRRNAYAEVRPT
jgi:hypothetical protein